LTNFSRLALSSSELLSAMAHLGSCQIHRSLIAAATKHCTQRSLPSYRLHNQTVILRVLGDPYACDVCVCVLLSSCTPGAGLHAECRCSRTFRAVGMPQRLICLGLQLWRPMRTQPRLREASCTPQHTHRLQRCRNIHAGERHRRTHMHVQREG
jgi:hypothetical protein